jgi:hypothetical protein
LAIDVMELLRRYRRRIYIFIGVTTGLDIAKEFLRGQVASYIVSKLGPFGFWLTSNPWAFLTLSAVVCLLWLILAAVKELASEDQSVILDQHRRKFPKPKKALKWYTGAVNVAVVAAGLMVYGARRYYIVTHIAPPLGSFEITGSVVTTGQMYTREGRVFKLSNSLVPCSHQKVGYGVEGLGAMPGPDPKRPWLVLEPTNFAIVDQQGSNPVSLLFKVDVTNRGEPSIAKGWELCLIAANQTVKRFRAEDLSPIDLAGLGDKPVELAKTTFEQPIEHGRAITGWILFHIPRDSIELATMTGSLQCRDYRDRLSRTVFSTEQEKQ